MRGGLTVPNEEARSALASLPENRGADIKIGKPFQMAPCMSQVALDEPSSYWQKRGRKCPFATLSDENDDAAAILLTSLPEHTRPLVPALADALLADLSNEERSATLLRVSTALRSEAVIDAMYPKVDDKKHER